MQYSGVMVAFFLPPNVAEQLYSFREFFLSRSDIISPQDYHITLAYLPDIQVEQLGLLRNVVKGFTQSEHPILGKLGGMGRFSKHEENNTNAFYTSLDAPVLPGFRQRLVEKLDQYNFEVSKMHGFIPHCTMAYIPEEEPSPTLVVPYITVTFSDIWLAVGDNRYRFPLSSTATQLKERLGQTVGALAQVIEL